MDKYKLVPVKATSTTTKKKPPRSTSAPKGSSNRLILPRNRENQLKQKAPSDTFIIGIDEAGRGPVAGPLVAAAAVVPTDISGVTDSKKIRSEARREKLYEVIVASTNVSWAAAIVDASRIDETNILKATMQGMTMAVATLLCDNTAQWESTSKSRVSASRKGCYVTCGGRQLKQIPTQTSPRYYALVDGNQIPGDLPCNGESIVRGDSKEYAIAAASIIAKVTRDRLMRAYHQLYPKYEFANNKGYPTNTHIATILHAGASPIHRRTFAPLKHIKSEGHQETQQE